MNDAPNLSPDTTPVTSPVTETTNTGVTQPQSVQQVNWEARYNGLNSTYGKLQKKFEDLSAQQQQLLGESEELRQTVKKHDGDKATLTASLQAIEAEKSRLMEEAKVSAFNSERMKLILRKYPELASFEADGLLPSATTVEELEPKLESFKSKLGSNIDTGVKDRLKGTGPAQSARNETPVGGHSEDYIFNRLTQLGGHRTPEQEVEYMSLRDEWDALHKPA